MRTSNALLAVLPLALSALTGCGSDDEAAKDRGTGMISVRVYGESFIEDGIPADAMNDGWSVEFSRFDVTLADVEVAGAALSNPEPVGVHEPSSGEGHEIGTVSANVGPHDKPRFSIARIDAEGSAAKDGATKTFSWTFDTPTHYSSCATTTDVRKGETATFQITIHADHLFYDSLVSEEPQLLFQSLADADADDDGEITAEELGETDIGFYDPGNEKISDLWSFLVAQHRTLGHVDGEGHCETAAAH
jgi:hypothetical protein